MKRFLMILVMGLLFLSACSSTQNVLQSGKIKIGSTKAQVRSAFTFAGLSNDPFIGGCHKEYFADVKMEILSSKDRDVWLVFKNVNWPTNCPGDDGDGILALYVPTYSQAKELVLKAQGKTTAETKKKVIKKTTEKKAVEEATSGSAFFISNTGHIITNFHVIETCNNNSKIFYNNSEIDAKLIAKDKYLDLALLKAEVSNNKFITISNIAPKKLQRIIAAGYPFGKYLSNDMKFTSGIVSSLKGVQDDSTRLQIDAALNPGNSGGPIVDENTGELVAVAVAGLRKDITEGVNFGIKAGSVKNFLESNQLDTKTLEKKYDTGGIAELLENAVLYTFCN